MSWFPRKFQGITKKSCKDSYVSTEISGNLHHLFKCHDSHENFRELTRLSVKIVTIPRKFQGIFTTYVIQISWFPWEFQAITTTYCKDRYDSTEISGRHHQLFKCHDSRQFQGIPMTSSKDHQDSGKSKGITTSSNVIIPVIISGNHHQLFKCPDSRENFREAPRLPVKIVMIPRNFQGIATIYSNIMIPVRISGNHYNIL